MLGNMGLIIDYVFLRIKSGGDVLHKQCPCLLSQFYRILPYGYGMHIDYAIKAVILVLELRPVSESSKVISKGNIARRLHTAEYGLFFVSHYKFLFSYIILNQSKSNLY